MYPAEYVGLTNGTFIEKGKGFHPKEPHSRGTSYSEYPPVSYWCVTQIP